MHASYVTFQRKKEKEKYQQFPSILATKAYLQIRSSLSTPSPNMRE